jgi:hypothetical protein
VARAVSPEPMGIRRMGLESTRPNERVGQEDSVGDVAPRVQTGPHEMMEASRRMVPTTMFVY